MVQFFAIKHIKSGRFMPEYGNFKCSYSTHEPEDPEDWPPRMFKLKSSAEKALTAWAQGMWSRDSDGYVECTKVEGRHREDFKVVPIELTSNGTQIEASKW